MNRSPTPRKITSLVIGAGISGSLIAGCSPPIGLATDHSYGGPGCSSGVYGSIPPQQSPPGLVVPGYPFDAVFAADGTTIFASMSLLYPPVRIGSETATTGIAVLRRVGVNLTLQAAAPVTRSSLQVTKGLTGLTLSHSGQLLLAADANGVDVFATRRLESPNPKALLGRLLDAGNPGTFDVLVSPDDRYVFATNELTNSITIFDLRRALRTGFAGSFVVNRINVPPRPTGLTISSDGRYVFVTTEFSNTSQPTNAPGLGSLIVIDARRAERGDTDAVVNSVAAGCNPVRVALSPDGRLAWVTARGSNALLGFDTKKLLEPNARSLLGWARVGSQPVGLSLSANGSLAFVANSNRFNARAQTPTLYVLDTSALLARHQSLVTVVAVGAFPRNVAFSAMLSDLLVVNYGGRTLQLIPLSFIARPSTSR